jgi:hypothetical protein
MQLLQYTTLIALNTLHKSLNIPSFPIYLDGCYGCYVINLGILINIYNDNEFVKMLSHSEKVITTIRIVICIQCMSMYPVV